MKSDQIIKQRLKKTAAFARFFQLIPFVRAYFLNGSLAQGKSTETSDIDILIITKDGRLYTARFFLITLGFLTGIKRSKNNTYSHAGKFCFNYFLSDYYLKIPTGRGQKMDQYCADNYKASILIWGRQSTFIDFERINEALFGCSGVENQSPKEPYVDYFPVPDNKYWYFLKLLAEKLLSGRFGNWLESRSKQLQIRLIQRDDRTSRYPNLIVYNDQEARFHPPKNEGQIKNK